MTTTITFTDKLSPTALEFIAEYGEDVFCELNSIWTKHGIKAAFHPEEADRIMEDANVAGREFLADKPRPGAVVPARIEYPAAVRS